ncbi:MAG TPA: efflux RND transporter periplasmic adaptor subunit, partial [Verrucomicrobiae bacterium]|nr:efflux RND transporter periplasmic adaptor subunit [Verrucomicrobiae bacterium]
MILIIVSLLVVIGLLAGLLPRWRQRAALQSQTAELATPVVTVGFPKPGEAGPGVALPAEVKPFVEAPIYARANGYVKRWLVDIGARVEAGQLLAEIDTPELNQELAQARAELKQAEAALELARTTAARWKELLKTSSVSQQETAEKEADLALKQSSVDAANANVRRLEELQSFEEVTAPFAGTITDRRTDIGQLISTANPHPLFLLADVGKLRVYARVPQSIARAVQAGQTADVTIPEIPNRVF